MEYNNEKLIKLEKDIKERKEKLESELYEFTNKAIEITGGLDETDSSYRYIKEKIMSCEAQLRVIKYIKSDFKDKNFII